MTFKKVYLKIYRIAGFMKLTYLPVMLAVFLAVGCAHSPGPTSNPTQAVAQLPIQQQTVSGSSSDKEFPETKEAAALPLQQKDNAERDSSSNSEQGSIISSSDADADVSGDYQEPDGLRNSGDYKDIDESGKNVYQENTNRLTIADPLEPFNRAMFEFNDKLYFWVLKPITQGYKRLVHEDFRVVVKNFFSNAAFPVRFVNCLLQANIKGAASEVGRFALNTLVGFGGLFDPASDKEINLYRHDVDFGQTLGVYGIGQGFYINWPIFGPSSPRDTVGMAGDGFLNPFSHLNQWYESAGVGAYDKINDTSFRIGDYEALKQAAIDPYVAVRDAYVQYRFNKVKRREGSYSAPNGEERKQ